MLYSNSDTVALLERDGSAISVDSFSMSCAAVVVEPLDDTLTVLTSWVDLGDETVDGFCCVVAEEVGKLFEVDIHGKFEVNAESDVAASNVGIVGGSRVPGVGCHESGFGKDFVGASTTAFGFDVFVQKAMEAFHFEAFMVASSERDPTNFEGGAHLLEDIAKFAVCVDYNHACNTDSKEDIFEELATEVGCVAFLNGSDDDGRAEIVHSVEKTYVALVGNRVTGDPSIEVDVDPWSVCD